MQQGHSKKLRIFKNSTKYSHCYTDDHTNPAVPAPKVDPVRLPQRELHVLGLQRVLLHQGINIIVGYMKTEEVFNIKEWNNDTILLAWLQRHLIPECPVSKVYWTLHIWLASTAKTNIAVLVLVINHPLKWNLSTAANLTFFKAAVTKTKNILYFILENE